MSAPPELREAPVVRGAFPCHEVAPWAAEFGVVAGITDRGADFGLSSTEPTAAVMDRWRRLRNVLLPGFPTVVVAHQCHGTAIATHRAPGPGWRVLDETDGHLASQPGILLGVTVADCVPVYLVQANGAGVGVLHAGWRGIAGGIVERGIASVCELGACSASDIVMHCGISICDRCYEVGPEVWRAVTGELPDGQRRLDLRAQVTNRAERAGVQRVTRSSWCTAHDQGVFYSHRRSGGGDGRMVAYLGRPLP